MKLSSGHFGEKPRRRAVFAGQVANEQGVGLGRDDLLAVADDARVLQQRVDVVFRKGGDAARLETFEGLLKARPLGFDDLPDEARLKHPLGHFGEPAIIRNRHELALAFDLRQALL
jgi:hypothetical protein